MASNPFNPINVNIAREIQLRMVRTIILGLMAASALFVIGAVIGFREILLRSLVFGMGVVLIGAAALVLLNKGYERLPAVLIVTCLWLITFIGALTAGGIRAPIFMGSFVVILVAWALEGKRGGQIAMVACLGSSIFLYFAETNGMLLPRREYSPLAYFSITTFFMIAVFLFQRAQEMIVSDALARARTLTLFRTCGG